MTTLLAEPEVAAQTCRPSLPADAPVDASTDDNRIRPISAHIGESAVLDSKIAIVDDEPFNALAVKRYLEQAGFKKFVIVTDSREALRVLRSEKPDIVLLDVLMPEVNGLDVLRLLRIDDDWAHLPVLIMTAASHAETKRRALRHGATDFLPKPLDPHDLVPRVRNALSSKLYQDRLARQAESLEQQVRERTAELIASREEVLHCLARAAEFRDDQTGKHVIRVGKFAAIIARQIGLDPVRVEMIELAAQLHDIGKIGIPDSILHKAGRLDEQELRRMRKHCGFAKDIIAPLPEQEAMILRTHTEIGAEILQVQMSPLLALASIIAQTHHERWDGNGYPLGLAGEDIPLEGRITAVADVYDALSTERPYKPAFPRQKCFDILEEGR
ncbi:MAG: response regulator, partial [Planctomycetes bacterium]|nr:response regulator [Planctomycetota bacterium]